MQKDIDNKLDPGIGRQNLTPRRIRIAEGMRRDGERLEMVQRTLRRLADCHDNPALWDSLPASGFGLRGIRTRKDVEAMGREQLETLAGGKREETPVERVRKMERELVGLKIPGFFPTPAPVINDMLLRVDIRDGHRVLEPSAGKGDIADAILRLGLDITLHCCEISTRLQAILTVKGHTIAAPDLFDLIRGVDRYDRIVMNPPFEGGYDVKHVMHCFNYLLRPGGRLVSIVGEPAFFRTSVWAAGFRDFMEEYGGSDEKLPDGSFTGRESFRQTGTACRLIVIDKPQAEMEANEFTLTAD